MQIGGWVARRADDDLRRTFAEDDVDESGWEPIEVPGHWRATPAFSHADGPLLHRARFEGPDRTGDATSGLDAAWTATDRRWWLRFDGLCYQGDVWLDGSYLGDTEGYFQPHTFEVTDALAQRSEHQLAVEVTCAPQRDRLAKRNITGTLQHSPYLAPDWNPGGIWRPVSVSATGPVRIVRLRTRCTEASAERAVLDFTAELDAADAVDGHLRTTVGGVDHQTDRTFAAGTNTVEWTVTVDRPRRWWPHALGDPVLVDVEVDVRLGDGDGASSDVRRFRTGLRTVTVDGWHVRVNGERMFCKGTNLAPTRQDLAGATADEVTADVHQARTLGLDLVRVHGHVGRPELYDAADETGMLVWQDFPLQWTYGRTIRKQAERQAGDMVDVLGHHPSIALWCAHSEPVRVSHERDVAQHRTAPGDHLRQQLPTWNRNVLDPAVARAIARADGSRPVKRHTGVLPRVPALASHAANLWFGWTQGRVGDLDRFARRYPARTRFVAEFGAQAVPETDDFLDPAAWPDLDWRRITTAHNMQRWVFDDHVSRSGRTYEDWKRATQEHQAEVVRRSVELLRRIKYRPTGGFCQFHLADAHPSVSFSLLDHERVPKPGLAALAAACRPVIVVADPLPATVASGDALAVDVHVVSDRRVDLTGWVRAELDFGDHVPGHRWRFEGAVAADSCTKVGTIQFEVPKPVSTLTLTLTGQIGDDQPHNRYATRVIDRGI